MEVSYQQAMETLQSMFEKFDKETIQTVLASNEGHLERTIEDLMKLNEEVENLPDDDDNLFADTDSHPKARPRYPSGNGQEFYESGPSRSVQESEDAKLAYQLQMQEIKAEQQEKQAAINQYHHESGNANNANNANQYGGNQQYANQYANQYGHQQGGMQETDPKKASFYKKVKVGLNNLFKRKGKAGKKGPTRNPGIYTQIDGNDGNVPFNAEDDDNDAPMQLADVLGGPSHNNNNDDSQSPESPRSPSHYRNDLREYNRNRPSQLNQMDYGGEL